MISRARSCTGGHKRSHLVDLRDVGGCFMFAPRCETREGPMAVSITQARPEDVDFIVEQTLAGAREGHFDSRLLQPRGQLGVLHDMRSIVERNRRFDDESLMAHALVFRDGGQAIGFAIVSDTPPQLSGQEIYAFYIAADHRNKGHGRNLLERLKERVFSKGDALFVRCLPQSQLMFDLLTASGFECVGHNELGARIMHHPPRKQQAGRVGGNPKNRR